MTRLDLKAPLTGVLVPIEQVPDPVFAQKMVGEGVSIDPRSNRLLAPCDGEVSHLHPASQRAQGLTFQVVVEVLEWLGAEELAYFRVQGARASARELEELAADSGSTDVPQAGDQLVARLDPASRAREGKKLELWVDPHKAQLFNAQNGAHLTL